MTDGKGLVPTGKSKFARARERLEARERQRGAAPKPVRRAQTSQDSVIMDYVCAQNGRPFTIVFAREDRQSKYHVAEILTGQSSGHGLAPSDTKDLPADLFRWGELKCPHCKTVDGGVHCSVCGHDVCGGTKSHERDGTRRFRCQPLCGHESRLRRLEQVSARLPGAPGGPDISTAGPPDFSRVRAGVLRLPPPPKR
jgi:hypothetical protein